MDVPTTQVQTSGGRHPGRHLADPSLPPVAERSNPEVGRRQPGGDRGLVLACKSPANRQD